MELEAELAVGDPDRAVTVRLAPPDLRPRLVALYAFNLALARAPWASREPLVARMRVQFWADAVEAAYAGHPPAHPAAQALGWLLSEVALPRGPFEALLAARAGDCDPTPPELDGYLADTGGAVMALAARALGAEADGAATALGWAAGAAGLLRALPALAARGRLPMPGTGVVDLVALQAGRTTPELASAVAAVGAAGRARLAQGRAEALRAPRAARPALWAGWRARRTLRAARPGVDVLRDLGDESEARRRLGLLWCVWTGTV